jgi:hypothetical protein
MDLASIINFAGLFLAGFAAYENWKETKQVR